MRQKRETNIEIASAGRRLELEVAELICECVRGDCTQRIVVRLDEFDGFGGRGLYAIRAGHENGPNEQIVDRREGYVLVERTDS